MSNDGFLAPTFSPHKMLVYTVYVCVSLSVCGHLIGGGRGWGGGVGANADSCLTMDRVLGLITGYVMD